MDTPSAGKTPASKHGFRYFANELRILEEMYRDGPTNPRQIECENLAWTFTTREQRVQAGLPVTWRQIKTWFDNRRQKDRREALGKKLPPRVRKKKGDKGGSQAGSETDDGGDKNKGAESKTLAKLETLERMRAFNACDMQPPQRSASQDLRMQRAAVREAVRTLKDTEMTLQELTMHLADVGNKLEYAPLLPEAEMVDILRTAVERAKQIQPPPEEQQVGSPRGAGEASGSGGSLLEKRQASFGRSTSFSKRRAITRSNSRTDRTPGGGAVSPPPLPPLSNTGEKLSETEADERFDRVYSDFNLESAPIVDDLRLALENDAADEVLLGHLKAFKGRLARMMDEVGEVVDRSCSKTLMDHARQYGMWVGGLEPSVMLHSILPVVQGELTAAQGERIQRLLEEVEAREYKLSCALDALIESAATVACIDKDDNTSAVAVQAKVLARTLSGLGTEGITGVESILKHADQLRLRTLDELGAVLGAKQSAKAVIAVVNQRNHVRIAAAFLGHHIRL
mmetsp:Transcript_23997/g.75117  ORF Transcript_23997/g.75117 Transcript_23997/m.75117 type:complete len:512 (+) Transcript_23997:4186-5721(+)